MLERCIVGRWGGGGVGFLGSFMIVRVCEVECGLYKYFEVLYVGIGVWFVSLCYFCFCLRRVVEMLFKGKLSYLKEEGKGF